MSETYYAVCLDKVHLYWAKDGEPIAFFKVYADAVKFSEDWPRTTKVKPMSKSYLIELLQND